MRWCMQKIWVKKDDWWAGTYNLYYKWSWEEQEQIRVSRGRCVISIPRRSASVFAGRRYTCLMLSMDLFHLSRWLLRQARQRLRGVELCTFWCNSFFYRWCEEECIGDMLWMIIKNCDFTVIHSLKVRAINDHVTTSFLKTLVLNENSIH